MRVSPAETPVVASYGYRHEAEFAQETLAEAGIDSALVADDAGGAYMGLAFSRPIRLLVRAPDLERARRLVVPGTDSA